MRGTIGDLGVCSGDGLQGIHVGIIDAAADVEVLTDDDQVPFFVSTSNNRIPFLFLFWGPETGCLRSISPIEVTTRYSTHDYVRLFLFLGHAILAHRERKQKAV